MAKTPKTTTAPTGSIAPFGLRMLPELRAKVEESAKESGRSMNAEIVSRIEASYTLPTEPYALQSQLERVLGDAAKSNNGMIYSVGLVRDMLGGYVLDLFNRLPVEEKKDPKVLLMVQLAFSAIENKGDLIADAFEKLFLPKGPVPAGVDAKDFFRQIGEDNVNASERRRKMLEIEPPPDQVEDKPKP